MERTEHILSNVCSELQKVPTTVERLSCINGILPEGHQFNAEEAVDYIEMERILIGDMRDGVVDLVQSSVRLLNNMKRFRTMQNSRCKPYEEMQMLLSSSLSRMRLLPPTTGLVMVLRLMFLITIRTMLFGAPCC